MTELSQAFGTINFETKNFQNIEYFFTQRNLKEEHEFLDQNFNRKNKQVNIVYNFLAISIPNYELGEGNNSSIDAEIFGDNGYHYNGTFITAIGNTPNFMVPLKGDKKIFVHLSYKEYNKETLKESPKKEFICFIEVPKRFQSVDNSLNKLKNESEIES